MISAIGSRFRALGLGLLLLAFLVAPSYGQVSPVGGTACGGVDAANQRPVFATGAGGTIWACPPGSVWFQLYPLGGTTPNSPTALLSNTSIGNTAERIAHATYSFAVDGGAVGVITPLNNFKLPANAVVTNAGLECTTAMTSGSSATISVGLSGTGGGAAVLLAATAVASMTGRLQSAVVPQTASGWKKITTASGQLTLTVAVAALTAGVCEVYVNYFDSAT